jgi:hypothetical protein
MFTLKVYGFSFVNCYFSFFWIAFFKKDCPEGSCFNELSIQLISVFVTATLMNVVEIGMPILLAKKAKEKENINSAEIDVLMIPASNVQDD